MHKGKGAAAEADVSYPGRGSMHLSSVASYCFTNRAIQFGFLNSNFADSELYCGVNIVHLGD